MTEERKAIKVLRDTQTFWVFNPKKIGFWRKIAFYNEVYKSEYPVRILEEKTFKGVVRG